MGSKLAKSPGSNGFMSRSSNNSRQHQHSKKNERASSMSLADVSHSYLKPVPNYNTGDQDDAKSHFDPSPIKKSPSPIKKILKSKGSKGSKGASD